MSERPIDFSTLLKLPPYAARPRPLPPAGYFIRLRDGRCIPITLPARAP